MLLALTLLLALQGAPAAAPPQATPRPAAPATRADTGAAGDSTPPDEKPIVHERIPLTPALLASAFRDATARDLITRARIARLAQDSSLVSYDAMSKERLTVGLSFRGTGRLRTALRSETAARVRWRAGNGARVDIVGARTAMPMFFPGARVLQDMLDDPPIPYFPGREGLMPLAGTERVTRTSEGVFIHPLDSGAEAYYQYRSGDSVTFALPTGQRIRLREVIVVARAPRSDLIVGSLWFDAASAHLVRAVYRPAAVWDIRKTAEADDSTAFDDVPRLVRPIIFPMNATIGAFTVEYGLYDQRWWLPRSQTVQGRAQIGFTHVSFEMLETFRFASVDGTDSTPPIPSLALDSMRTADSMHVASRRNGNHRDRDSTGDSTSAGTEKDDDLRGLSCARGDTIVEHHMRYDRTLPIVIHIPCDTVALAHSPELPPSIFSSGEQVFDVAGRDELVKSLSLSLQPGWHPAPLSIHYGLQDGLVRYNRVEGLSAGVRLDEQFGSGYAGTATLRLGVADWQPDAELHVSRSNGRRTITGGAYRRLDSANDWGDPFSLGSSLDALVFGNDEGFYYRSWGAELSGGSASAADFALSWRVFAERQSNAPLGTNFSIPNVLHDDRFTPNLRAAPASAYGVSLTVRDAYGVDPQGWRFAFDTRAEGATGTFDYARGALDMTLARGFGTHLSTALTAGAGSSVGDVPAQRLWYLGGVRTVRGQSAGTQSGDSYWLAHADVGYGLPVVRPTAFVDLGWAGPRARWLTPGRQIMSGAGVGASFLDGLLHFDVARGIHPGHGVHVDFYVEGRL
ncbi:MAG TPA: hypothetical protein VN677_15535 [Gemmatimonadaceae bacterium]|nr:hypothetical protein [Gemmatimonadaceae bacterium]